MSTYTQILYHIVFSTKNRTRCLIPQKRNDLFRYIWGIINNKKSHLYRIGGIEDHLHILTGLHPTVYLSDYVKDIKTCTSRWIKTGKMFPGFTGWQEGYGAFTHSINEKDVLVEYVENQEAHHRKIPFREEFRELLQEAGITFDEKYLV